MPKQKRVPAFDLPIDSPERRRLPVLLRHAWYGLNRAFRRRIAHLAVTPDQFTVMRTLLEHAGITQRKLTELMSSDPNTVASLLERMEKAGLVERQSHEQDRRAHRLNLKALGRRKYEAAREIAIAMQSEILSALPSDAPVQLWIYRADPTTGLPDSGNFTTLCTRCVVYNWDLTLKKWNTTSPVVNNWPATGSGTAQNACIATADSVGVWVKATHKMVSGFFGSVKTLTDHTVMRLEPLPSDQVCSG